MMETVLRLNMIRAGQRTIVSDYSLSWSLLSTVSVRGEVKTTLFSLLYLLWRSMRIHVTDRQRMYSSYTVCNSFEACGSSDFHVAWALFLVPCVPIILNLWLIKWCSKGCTCCSSKYPKWSMKSNDLCLRIWWLMTSMAIYSVLLVQ